MCISLVRHIISIVLILCFFLVTDNSPKEKDSLKFPFSMSSDGNDNVVIPSVFIEGEVGRMLVGLVENGKQVRVLITWATEDLIKQLNSAECKAPTPPTPIGPTNAPSVTEHHPSKPTEQDFREVSSSKVSNSGNEQELPVEEEDETAGCSASSGLFDSGREDEQQEHVENSVDDVHR